MSRIHVCLVSGQPIPNLIPLKTEELAPQKVILLVSHDMVVQADRIESVIKDWKIEVERYPIVPYDLESAREICLDILARFEDSEVTLNVTGGTKIMALAAFEVFREMRRPIIYVDTQNKEIQKLSPQPEKMKFRGVIKVTPYLTAYGQNLVMEDTDPERIKKHRPIIDKLIRDVERMEKGVSLMNKYSAPYRNNREFPLEVEVSRKDLSAEPFLEVLNLFQEHEIIERKSNKLTFHALADINFASGGWLEEYVFRVVNSISPTNIKMGVKVQWDQKGPKPPTNEYDVVFTKNNRLYLIECKTKRFEGEDKEPNNIDTIYKLDSLRDAAGGLFGKGMLVSYRKLTSEQKKRLKANKLDYCDRSNLKNLSQKIKEWVKQDL